MWKINKENLISLIKVGIIWLGLLFWIFILFFAVPLSLVKNEKILDIYIPSVILVILVLPVLVVLYYSCIAYKNNKPKYIDWKYMWKDWRVYEGDWDKKRWANWKWKLTWADGSYYEWEFKKGHLSWKWKKVLSNWTIFEWTWVNWFLEWKWKLVWHDWWIYEWEFKKGKPHWMWAITMNNWCYYEWEFKDWKRTWKLKKEILPSWTIVEGEFINNWDKGIDWDWKLSLSNWFVLEWKFNNWRLNWEWRTIMPEWNVYEWIYDNWEFKKWKLILKNWEYSEWNRVDWVLTWLARYYFKDWSYYEWECGQWNWGWIWEYVTKKWDRYSTEFPYEIINDFMCWLNSKIKEIQWILNYIPKTKKEELEEKNKYLEISKKWILVQKEIVKLSLDEQEKVKNLLDSIKVDNSLWNKLEVNKSILKLYEEDREKSRIIADKNKIKCSKSASSNSYWRYFYELDCNYGIGAEILEFFIKFDKFLDSKNILDLVTKKEEISKERVFMVDRFSEKYRQYIQRCLDWREYEKKFWNHNFKPNKDKK